MRAIRSSITLALGVLVVIQGYYLHRLAERLEAAPRTESHLPAPLTGSAAISSGHGQAPGVGHRAVTSQTSHDAVLPIAAGQVVPVGTLIEQGERYRIDVALPAVDNLSVDVRLDDPHTLVISASAATAQAANGQDAGSERPRAWLAGQFVRVITLPQPVDATSLTTRRDNGVLAVTVAKQKSI